MNNSTCINVIKILATAMVFFCHSWVVSFDTFDFRPHGWVHLLVLPAWAGVWLFLIIGGYLAGYGFYGGKYSMNLEGVAKYFKNRVVKILIPTWVFISLEYILIYQEETITWDRILGCLTCTFYGNSSSVPGIGATWYVYIVMWLYFLTPIFIGILKLLEKVFGITNFSFYFFILLIVCVLGCAYRITTYFYLDWYKYTYANILGCLDLFVAGIITYKLTSLLPNMSNESIRILRFWVILLLIVLICICSDFGFLLPYGELLYRYIWPSAFLLITCILLILYGYKTNDDKRAVFYKMKKVVNNVAPYTFAFYLWHSSMLMYVAVHLNIVDGNRHFFMTMIGGFLISSYMAYLMTKMNNGIIKSLL